MPRGPKQSPGRADLRLVDVLRAVMADRGMSQADLARRMPISEAQVSRIFAGIRPMTVTELAYACDVLDVPLSQVFRDAGL